MSKSHDVSNQDDLDAALDQYIRTKSVKPITRTIGAGVDVFGSAPEKKKTRVQRLLMFLLRLLPSNRT